MNKKTVNLKEYGSCLGTRNLAEQIRNSMGLDKQDSYIEINFNGVEIINNSFADELLGKIVDTIGIDKFKELVKIKNVNEYTKATINMVLSRRL